MTPPAEPPASPPVYPRGPWLPTLLVLFLSLGATLIAWTFNQQAQERRDLSRLNRFVGRTQGSLQNRLGRYEDIARGARGYFQGEPLHQSVQQWQRYVASLDLEGRHVGLRSLAYIVSVPDAELEAFLATRRQLRGQYHRPPPGPGQAPDRGGDHLIIELCEPAHRNADVPGLDVGYSPSHRLAAERARDTGEPALTGRLTFTLPEGPQDAVALLLPVYSGSTPKDLETRRTTLRGWVAAGILLKPLLDDIIRGEDQGIAFELVDASSPLGTQPLYTAPDWPQGSKPDQVRPLDIPGHGWQVRYAIKPGFYQTEGRSRPLLFLLGGLTVSLALATLVWSLAGTRTRALNLAQSMNASLYEALQRNRSHLASTPLAVIETDAHFHIREWNPTAEHIFGYSRAEALGQDPRMLLPDESQQEVAPSRAALLGSAGGTHVSMENLTRGGQRIYCDWYSTALRDERGYLLGAIFLADDITDQRRAEGALRQSQKLESLGVLAGGIAHDFNNLLTAILGNTEVALELIPDDKAMRHALQRIESTTHRGADLARQLLAYAGKAHFAIKPLDLNAIILELGDLLSVSISKKVGLQRDLQPGLPLVEADSAQFQQVVMNLVINASEAIGDRPGSVTLRTRSATYSPEDLAKHFPGQVLEPGRYVRLEVQDDGCGMDAETIGRIFDPFFTTKFTGRGLGLSAMLGIVRGHRAGLHVESVPGKGTTFILLFPASSASAPLPEPVALPQEVLAATVLVVDDESIIRDLARSALESAGCTVLEARDGLDAVEFFQSRTTRVDLVLLDMTMPRMGGAEAFRRIRELHPEMRVLLTSGYTQKEAQESLLDHPPDGFLQKPFRIRELVGKVREILQSPKGPGPA